MRDVKEQYSQRIRYRYGFQVIGAFLSRLKDLCLRQVIDSVHKTFLCIRRVCRLLFQPIPLFHIDDVVT